MIERGRASKRRSLKALWAHHHVEFRDPHQVAGQWQRISQIDPEMLRFTVHGEWWETLAATGQTLIITREYEHLVIAVSATKQERTVSYLRLPHPSGLAVNRADGRLYIASTRNPNMIYEFLPCRGFEQRHVTADENLELGSLLPSKSRYLPGCLYIHDIALIQDKLYANAVAMNTIVELPETGGYRHIWWPRAIDSTDDRYFRRNYLQLNSIASGSTIEESFFSASAATPSARRPGHINFPIDRRGVIFSGKTRDVIATGLTRPHSARLVDGTIWVDNSGYGEVGRVVTDQFEPIAKLPGWTRGLCHYNDVLFVGTSRIIPRFRHYAPGVDWRKSHSGVHAIDLKTGRVLGSLCWPFGNQIFAIERISTKQTKGFPFRIGRRTSTRRLEQFFFTGLTGYVK